MAQPRRLAGAKRARPGPASQEPDVTTDAQPENEIQLATPEILVVDENICVKRIRPLASINDALKAMTRIPEDWGVTESSGDLVIASPEHARLGRDLTAAVIESYNQRDLRNPDIRKLAVESVLHATSNTIPNLARLPASKGKVSDATARGFFLIMPMGRGRRVTAGSIAAHIGGETWTEPVHLNVDGRLTTLPQVKVLRLQWRNTIHEFGLAFLHAVDESLGDTQYAEVGHQAFKLKQRDAVSLLKSFLLGLSVGVLIVERISYKDAESKRAHEVWEMLGEVTRETGIPILFVVTPGAAAKIVERQKGLGELNSCGTYYMPAEEYESEPWSIVTTMLFKNYLAPIIGPEEPTWLANSLWSLSSGLYRFARKICAHTSSVLKEERGCLLSEEMLEEFANDALVLEQPYLNAVRAWTLTNARLTAASVKQFADWLPLDAVMQTVPGIRSESGNSISVDRAGATTLTLASSRVAY